MAQKILFADDDPEIREVLRLLLSSEGYDVSEASSGSELLEKLDDGVDLVILDVMMPWPRRLRGLRRDTDTLRRTCSLPHGQIAGLGQDDGLFRRR